MQRFKDLKVLNIKLQHVFKKLGMGAVLEKKQLEEHAVTDQVNWQLSST